MSMNSCIYRGTITHVRHMPKRHAFHYRVFSLLLDLDELESLAATSKILGINKSAPLSFWEKDHGAESLTGLKSWAVDHLQTAGYDTEGVRILVLCYPRIFGYVFNPLTVYYCFARDGKLIATLHEVQNTHGEKHTYILPTETDPNDMSRSIIGKRMFVSPFTELASTYRFSLNKPNGYLSLTIDLHTEGVPVLTARLRGARQTFSDRALLMTFVQFPLMTLKVMVGIHFEALRLWLKRVRVIRHSPADQKITSSYAMDETKTKLRV